MLDPDAVVGINGDFFDIRDTEAPLGVAKDRQRGIMNGVESGWNSAFWIDAAGVPHIGDLYADTVLRQRPDLDIATVNSPSVRPDGVGLYTSKWGTLKNYRVVDGQHRSVRIVVVRHGRVVSNRPRLPASLRVRDLVLVGRGAGAGRLARLRAGQRLTADVTLSQDVAVAVTGNMFVLRDGVRVATDDVDLHPRTAIGIDRDTGQLLLLVVDGRQSFSRGLDHEGARRAVPTARRRGRAQPRRRRLLDPARPADRWLAGGPELTLRRPPRPVANGLEVTYDAPPATPPS